LEHKLNNKLNHKIIKNSTGEWHGILQDDCVVIADHPEYVAGYLAAYVDSTELVRLAIDWKQSGFSGRQELALVSFLKGDTT